MNKMSCRDCKRRHISCHTECLKSQGVRDEKSYARKGKSEAFMINYDELNRELNEIYAQKFYGIDGTPYEYHYLEEEHYALRRRGKLNFVIVRAKSPLEAIENLKGEF